MGDLGRTGLNEALKRRYDIDTTRPLTSLAPDLFAVIPANDRDLEPDIAALAGVRRYSAGYEISANPTFIGAVALVNPTGSGVLLTIDKVIIGGLSAYWAAYIAREDPPSGATGSKHAPALDTRYAVYAGGACSPANKSASSVYYWLSLADQSARLCEIMKIGGPAAESGGVLEKNWTQWEYPIVLSPGGFMLVQDSSEAEEMFVYFNFRERVMAPVEASLG